MLMDAQCNLVFILFLVKLDWEGARMQVSSDVQLQLHSCVCIHSNNGLDLYVLYFPHGISTRFTWDPLFTRIQRMSMSSLFTIIIYLLWSFWSSLLVADFLWSLNCAVAIRRLLGDVVYILAFWDWREFSERDGRARQRNKQKWNVWNEVNVLLGKQRWKAPAAWEKDKVLFVLILSLSF